MSAAAEDRLAEHVETHRPDVEGATVEVLERERRPLSPRRLLSQLEPEPLPDEDYALQRAFFISLLGLVGAMHAASVQLLAGTDPPVRGVFPGFSLHDELELLVEAGLTPLQALQVATLNPARFLACRRRLAALNQANWLTWCCSMLIR